MSEKAREKKQRVYADFMNLEKAYNVGGNLLNGITGMYVNSLGFVRVKRSESESLIITSDSGVQGRVISHWLFGSVC